MQDGFENTVPIHTATLSPTSMCYCDDEPPDKEEAYNYEKPRSEGKSDKTLEGSDSPYAVNMAVSQICSRPVSCTWYVDMVVA